MYPSGWTGTRTLRSKGARNSGYRRQNAQIDESALAKMANGHPISGPDPGIGTRLRKNITCLKFGGTRNETEVLSMITFIEGGDVNTLRARHVTHVGVMHKSQ